MLPTKFRFIWPSGFGEEFKKSANQKQELPVAAMFVNGSCHDITEILLKVALSTITLTLLTDLDEMSNLYRGPSIDASYQVSVHLTKRFRRRRFLKIGHSETRIACGGHVC
jgi:hypothetical protein